MAVSEDRLFKRVCKIDRGLLRHFLQTTKPIKMLVPKIPNTQRNNCNAGNWKINEQCVSASSTPEGQSSIPSHHTDALTQASNSGQRYWHSPACRRIRPKPLGGSGLLKQHL